MGVTRGQFAPQPKRFLDGCHQYGWLISPVLSALVSAIMFAYYIGGVNTNIQDLQRDITMLKQQVFDLAHITRGIGTTLR